MIANTTGHYCLTCQTISNEPHNHGEGLPPCEYCTPQPGSTPESLAHSPERCPRVAAISYRSDGSIRRVEFSR